MDKHKSHFKKGREGHPRNVNPYAIFRQRMKKWRYPFIGIGMVALFFMSFQITGEALQTNTLTTPAQPPTAQITVENFEDAKKTLLAFIKEQVDACADAGLNSCVAEGRDFMRDIADADTPEKTHFLMNDVEIFHNEWAELLGSALCEKEITDAFVAFGNSLWALERVLKNHSENIRDASVLEVFEELQRKFSSFYSAAYCR